jgi:hypothetical protein
VEIYQGIPFFCCLLQRNEGFRQSGLRDFACPFGIFPYFFPSIFSASASFQDEKAPKIERKFSDINQKSPTPSVESAPLPVQPLSPEKVKEEEARIRKEHDLALENVKNQLAKEKIEEEKKMR